MNINAIRAALATMKLLLVRNTCRKICLLSFPTLNLFLFFKEIQLLLRLKAWFMKMDSLQKITDDAVKELSEQCPRLHYVCLSNCPNLTDASLVTLAQHCPLLSVLECVACTHFTDAGFQALAKVSWSSWLIRLAVLRNRPPASRQRVSFSRFRTADCWRRWIWRSAF